jgi:outer membrane biosynthesis protein TonB
MRRLASLLVLAAACAHAPPAEDPEVAALETHRAEAAEGQTAPVRKSCRGRGPRLPQGETVSGVIHATYLVGADGKVSDVKITGRASAVALKAIQRYVASCTYKPALREGKPVAVRWRGDLDFTTAPARQ